MQEVQTVNEMIDAFPMYSNVSLPNDVLTIMDNAYTSLLVYREQGKITDGMAVELDVFFIEDSPSLKRYFENILYERNLKVKVFGSVVEALVSKINPKVFFIDVSAIDEHVHLLTLIKEYPNAKIVLMTGIIKYVERFITEMKQMKNDIELDYISSRDKRVILNKINSII